MAQIRTCGTGERRAFRVFQGHTVCLVAIGDTVMRRFNIKSQLGFALGNGQRAGFSPDVAVIPIQRPDFHFDAHILRRCFTQAEGILRSLPFLHAGYALQIEGRNIIGRRLVCADLRCCLT